MEGKRRDAGLFEQGGGARHQSGRDDSRIRDEQRARKRQIAREGPQPVERAVAEYDAHPQLEIERARHYLARAMRYNFDAVRTNTLPRATAGDASAISFSELFPMTLNSGPASIV